MPRPFSRIPSSGETSFRTQSANSSTPIPISVCTPFTPISVQPVLVDEQQKGKAGTKNYSKQQQPTDHPFPPVAAISSFQAHQPGHTRKSRDDGKAKHRAAAAQRHNYGVSGHPNHGDATRAEEGSRDQPLGLGLAPARWRDDEGLVAGRGRGKASIASQKP